MAEPPVSHVNDLVEHLFRHQAGQMLATLTHIFGLEHLELAEDVVQDAMVQALKQWPYHGVPDNPRAWLIRVARNRALDALRRKSTLRRVETDLIRRLDEMQQAAGPMAHEELGGFQDEQLAMIFACCHPALPEESRVALTLKSVSCFSVPEIARAFLSEPTTVAQRLVRAKRRIKEARIRLSMPEPGEQAERLDSVLQVLYLVFNEGYSAHEGAELVRVDLCAEAIRLAELLTRHQSTDLPRVHALLAMFCLQSARLPARIDSAGDLLLLEDQDRSRWDHELLSRGLRALDRAAVGDDISDYHLQAGIAAVHATSPSFAATDWRYLVELYDQLAARAPTPVVLLNRAIAVSMVEGPEAALLTLDKLAAEPSLRHYYLLPSVRADLFRRLGRSEDAAESYRQALARPCTDPERRFLLRRLEQVTAPQCASR